jgi:O-antigen/teichoic acid export membrane protein
MVTVTLGFINEVYYSIWLTISSIVAWGNISDLGITNGLRNRIAHNHNDNVSAVEDDISVSIRLFLLISVLILILSNLLLNIVPIEILFKDLTVDFEKVRATFWIAIIGFCVNFVLNIGKAISLGYQKSRVIGLAQVLVPICAIVGINISKVFMNGDIEVYAFIMVLSQTIVNAFIFLWILKRENLNIKFQNISLKNGKDLYNLGIKFFVIQIVALVLFATDNIIISAFISAGEVAEYSIVYKVYSGLNTFFSILLIQLWSATTKAISKEKYDWVANKVKLLLKLLIPFAIIVILITLLFQDILSIWLDDQINVRNSLVLVNAAYSILVAWNGIFTNVMNGFSILKSQIIIGVFTALINIPLSLILAIRFELGITGVLLATFICVSITAIVLPIQYGRIMRSKLL